MESKSAVDVNQEGLLQLIHVSRIAPFTKLFTRGLVAKLVQCSAVSAKQSDPTIPRLTSHRRVTALPISCSRSMWDDSFMGIGTGIPEHGDTVVLRLRDTEVAELRRLARSGQMCGSRTRKVFNQPDRPTAKGAEARNVISFSRAHYERVKTLVNTERMPRSARAAAMQVLTTALTATTDDDLQATQSGPRPLIRSDRRRIAGPPPKRVIPPAGRSTNQFGVRLQSPLPREVSVRSSPVEESSRAVESIRSAPIPDCQVLVRISRIPGLRSRTSKARRPPCLSRAQASPTRWGWTETRRETRYYAAELRSPG